MLLQYQLQTLNFVELFVCQARLIVLTAGHAMLDQPGQLAPPGGCLEPVTERGSHYDRRPKVNRSSVSLSAGMSSS